MIKDNVIWMIVAISFLLACSSESSEVKVENDDSLDQMEMIDTTINIDDTSSMVDKNKIEPMDSVQEEAYKNDLSLEIKPIKEEEEDPISEECGMLLEEYASAIKSYDALLSKIEEEPDNISLMVKRTPMEENLDSYATKPQFFNCSQNKAFKKQFDILNSKKDKLLYN